MKFTHKRIAGLGENFMRCHEMTPPTMSRVKSGATTTPPVGLLSLRMITVGLKIQLAQATYMTSHSKT